MVFAMNRSALNPTLLSRLLVCLLVVGLAVQWTTNAVGMGVGGGGGGGMVSGLSQGGVADQVLVDLAASICSKAKAAGGQIKAAHCQHCVPAVSQLLAAPAGAGVSRLALAIRIGPASRAQILPPTRRQPGDGFSRAPPSIA